MFATGFVFVIAGFIAGLVSFVCAIYTHEKARECPSYNNHRNHSLVTGLAALSSLTVRFGVVLCVVGYFVF